MNIEILFSYMEYTKINNLKPTFKGLNIYNKFIKNMNQKGGVYYYN